MTRPTLFTLADLVWLAHRAEHTAGMLAFASWSHAERIDQRREGQGIPSALRG